MFDTLPFPNITAKDAEERSKQTVDYLIQFKEDLEFVLNAIVNGEYEKLASQPMQTANAVETHSADNGLTIAEVVNSSAFKAFINKEIEGHKPKVTFSVNFETGNLEYTSS